MDTKLLEYPRDIRRIRIIFLKFKFTHLEDLQSSLFFHIEQCLISCIFRFHSYISTAMYRHKFLHIVFLLFALLFL